MTSCTYAGEYDGYTYMHCNNPTPLNFRQIAPNRYTLTITDFISINDSPSYINVGIFNPQNYTLTDVNSGTSLTLTDAYNRIGSKYITIGYSCSLNGQVNTTLCPCTTTLTAQAIQPYSPNNFAGTSEKMTSIVSVPTSGNDTYNGDKWIPLYTNVNWLMQSLNVGTTYSDNNCGCAFDNPYFNLYLNLKVDVFINLRNFCTISGRTNINYPICYNYISNLCTSGNGCDSQISAYLASYCNSKYPPPENGLNIFNRPLDITDQDYNLCGCNMPQTDYDVFEQSLVGQDVPAAYLGSVDPHCLVPACYQSPFQPATLDNCPVPQCLNVTSINNSNISGNVHIDQSQECQEIYAGPAAPGSPSLPSPSPTPITTDESFWSKYWWLVLLIFFIVVIIIIIITTYILKNKSKTSK